MHASATARNVSLPDPFNFIVFKSSLHFFIMLDVINTGSCVGSWHKICHPAPYHKMINVESQLETNEICTGFKTFATSER